MVKQLHRVQVPARGKWAVQSTTALIALIQPRRCLARPSSCTQCTCMPPCGQGLPACPYTTQGLSACPYIAKGLPACLRKAWCAYALLWPRHGPTRLRAARMPQGPACIPLCGQGAARVLEEGLVCVVQRFHRLLAGAVRAGEAHHHRDVQHQQVGNHLQAGRCRCRCKGIVTNDHA